VSVCHLFLRPSGARRCRALLPTAAGALLTGGTDRAIRLWDAQHVDQSYVVCVPPPPYGSDPANEVGAVRPSANEVGADAHACGTWTRSSRPQAVCLAGCLHTCLSVLRALAFLPHRCLSVNGGCFSSHSPVGVCLSVGPMCRSVMSARLGSVCFRVVPSQEKGLRRVPRYSYFPCVVAGTTVVEEVSEDVNVKVSRRQTDGLMDRRAEGRKTAGWTKGALP
jgi:hypothetical protein